MEPIETIQETKPQLDKLDTLAQKAAIDDRGANFMEPGQKIKRGRGRPPGQKSSAEQTPATPKQEKIEIPTKEILKPVLNIGSKAIAGWVEDERASMTSDELEGAAMALGMVIDKYMPNAINKYGPEIMCMMVFGQYGLRVYALKKLKEIEKSDKLKVAENNISEMPLNKRAEDSQKSANLN